MFLKNQKDKVPPDQNPVNTMPRQRRRSSSMSIYKERVTSPVTRQRRRSSSISSQARMAIEGVASPSMLSRRRSSSMSLHDLTKNVNNIEELQLLHAVYQDDIDQTWELLQSGSDPNLTGGEGSPLLHIAVESGNEEMVKVLLSFERCKVDIEDVFGQTPLMKATIFDDVTIMKILHKAGARLNNVDQAGRTALLASLQDGKSQTAKFLIKNGCDVNVVDEFGQSALYMTIHNKQAECVKTVQRLMKAGYKLEKDKKWMEEERFDIKIIETKGLCTKLLGKFRNRINRVKFVRASSPGVNRQVLTIYE